MSSRKNSDGHDVNSDPEKDDDGTYDVHPHDETHVDVGDLSQVNLKRRLQSRHLQMIAIGGTIGTGLFISTGLALSTAGPALILIAYAFVGTIVGCVMLGLGEMATYIPVSGAFSQYGQRFVDPSLGFAMGWIYWFSWAITYALELETSGIIINYWAPNLNIGIFIGVFWLVITAVNFLPVNFYGEIEFWMSLIKVITVVGFFLFGICINAGAGDQGYIGFKYWHHPGAFNELITDGATGRFAAFWSVLVTAAFSYEGTELVGIAAGETDNPRKTIPAAIKKTFYRIFFFFVLTVFFIGILIPYTNQDLLNSDDNASASPLVIAAKLAGVKALPSIINAVLLTVVLSAANSDVYSGSRILVGLAQERSAPKVFAKTTKGGVPYFSVAFTAAFGLLAFLNEGSTAGQAFEWFLNITAVAGLIAWMVIGISHLAFMRALSARGVSRDSLPWKSPFQPWASIFGVFWCGIIILTQGFTAFAPWSTNDFFVAYVSLILFVVLYIGHKIVFRQPFVKPIEADLDTGRREVDELVFEDKKPTTLWGRFWYWMG